MDLNFLKAQMLLELEENFTMEEIFLVLTKILSACGENFVMKDYLISHRRDPQPELHMALLSPSFFCYLKYKNENVSLQTFPSCELQKTQFSILKNRATLTIFGSEKLHLSSQMPESPKRLLDFQKSLEAHISESAEALVD